MITGCGGPDSAAARSDPRPVSAAPAGAALAVGIGLRPGRPECAVRELLRRVAGEHGLDLDDAVVATLDRRTSEPGLVAAVAPRTPRGYPPAELAAVAVPTPDDRVAAATGTPAVAEAAALLAAGPGAELVVPKTAGDGVTVAVACRRPGPAHPVPPHPGG